MIVICSHVLCYSGHDFNLCVWLTIIRIGRKTTDYYINVQIILKVTLYIGHHFDADPIYLV